MSVPLARRGTLGRSTPSGIAESLFTRVRGIHLGYGPYTILPQLSPIWVMRSVHDLNSPT
jgi:hypothetical protein